MNNMPELKIGVVAVSRDCFPESLSVNRRKALIDAYTKKYGEGTVYECPICIVESEVHMVQALEDVKKAGCNALVVYLGNFGPEISETLLAKHFEGPKMFVAAAEETQDNLIQGRGDAYCGMLNASYNLKLRNVHAYIPEYPVGDAADCADMIHDFLPIARTVIGLSELKIISFGPRPLNFLACNAPIQQLYNLGVEIEENSELDLFEAFNKHAGDARIPEVVADMEKEHIICGYHTLINWDNTSEEKVVALIEVKVTPQRGMGFDKIAERIYQYNEVNAVYLMSGSFDFTVFIEGKTMRQVAQFVSDKLAPMESVLSTATHFVLKKYKDHGTIISEPVQDERMLITP